MGERLDKDSYNVIKFNQGDFNVKKGATSKARRAFKKRQSIKRRTMVRK